MGLRLNELNAKFSLGVRFGNGTSYEDLPARRAKLREAITAAKEALREQESSRMELQDRAESTLLFGEGAGVTSNASQPADTTNDSDTGNNTAISTGVVEELTRAQRWTALCENLSGFGVHAKSQFELFPYVFLVKCFQSGRGFLSRLRLKCDNGCTPHLATSREGGECSP